MDSQLRTYNRDSFTGLDYADQRFYASTYGRFNNPDPYKASGSAKDPGSWNRYSYAGGDPINFNDPRGLAKCHVVGTLTTRSNPDDGLAEYSTAEIQCTSAYGNITWDFNGVPFNGDRNQAAKDAEASYGADLDQTELDKLLFDGYTQAQGDLQDPTCAGVFGTADTRSNGWDPATILGSLFFGRTDLGSIGYGPSIVTGFSYAITTPTIKNFNVAAVISINADAWAGLDSRDRGLTLLHELGHAYNLLSLRGSGGSQISQFDIIPSINDANEETIWTKCGIAHAKTP